MSDTELMPIVGAGAVAADLHWRGVAAVVERVAEGADHCRERDDGGIGQRGGLAAGLTPQQLFAWRRQARSASVMDTERLSFASVVVAPVKIEIEFGGARILPRIETVIDVTGTVCPCCAGLLHRIDEDVSERLDIMPAQFRVLVCAPPEVRLPHGRTGWRRHRRRPG